MSNIENENEQNSSIQFESKITKPDEIMLKIKCKWRNFQIKINSWMKILSIWQTISNVRNEIQKKNSRSFDAEKNKQNKNRIVLKNDWNVTIDEKKSIWWILRVDLAISWKNNQKNAIFDVIMIHLRQFRFFCWIKKNQKRIDVKRISNIEKETKMKKQWIMKIVEMIWNSSSNHENKQCIKTNAMRLEQIE